MLFRTGDQSRDFALVLATNRPGDLDAAVLDRMDESLEFGLPGLNERRNILSQYVDQYIVKAGTAAGGAGAASDTGLWRRFSVSPQVARTCTVSCHSGFSALGLSALSMCAYGHCLWLAPGSSLARLQLLARSLRSPTTSTLRALVHFTGKGRQHDECCGRCSGPRCDQQSWH